MATQLQKQIMRRVYLVYVLRTVFQPAFVKLYIVLALLWQTTRYVSLPDVLYNASGALAPVKMYRFYIDAFANTEIAVQLIIFSVLLLGMWIVKDIAQGTEREELGVMS